MLRGMGWTALSFFLHSPVSSGHCCFSGKSGLDLPFCILLSASPFLPTTHLLIQHDPGCPQARQTIKASHCSGVEAEVTCMDNEPKDLQRFYSLCHLLGWAQWHLIVTRSGSLTGTKHGDQGAYRLESTLEFLEHLGLQTSSAVGFGRHLGLRVKGGDNWGQVTWKTFPFHMACFILSSLSFIFWSWE